ncbi:MAG: hypothetical protein HYZ07_00530 [Candidatus Harrisonbacteria bacterium]|nr:hypothetical protein [Candidatus Harrisonbacteria bacterium]MBI3114428.1 hypothetical protein [Candidatus Harrisonbacteria bacterium]
MKRFIITSSIIFTLGTSLVLAEGLVPECEGVKCSICDLVKLANNVIGWLTRFSFALAIIAVAVGGYFLLVSGGSEERVKKGKQIITSAVIGLFIVLAAWAIVNTVLQVIIGARTPFPWHSIPEDCGTPGFTAQPRA